MQVLLSTAMTVEFLGLSNLFTLLSNILSDTVPYITKVMETPVYIWFQDNWGKLEEQHHFACSYYKQFDMN